MKEAAKKGSRDPIIINVTKLADNVNRAEAKNIIKFNEIMKQNPGFEFKLYKPAIPSYETREQISLAEDIMLRQIDKLMEDQEKLNIQLNKCMIKRKEREKKMEKQIMINMDHYTFLRKLWKKDDSIQRTDEKVEKLIHNVGSIKGHIFNLIKRQSHLSESAPEIHELIVSSPEYCDLLKKYEQLKSQFDTKIVQEKQETTNNTSQSSIDSEDTKKQNEQLEAEVARLNLQLINKNNEIQRLKRGQSNAIIKLNSESQQLVIKQDQDSIDKGAEKNTLKMPTYIVKSIDQSFIIKIYETIKSSASIESATSQVEDTKSITSNQGLDSIIKFIESSSIRRASKPSISNTDQKQSEACTKKFSVQDITRAKFISTRLANQSVKQNDSGQV